MANIEALLDESSRYGISYTIFLNCDLKLILSNFFMILASYNVLY